LIDYYSQRGFLAGPAAIYRKIDGCDDVDGIFQSGFIHDEGTKSELGRDSLGQPIQRKRYFIEWHHQQNITEDLQITGQLRKWSDSASLRDFRPNLFNGDKDPDNFAEAVYSGSNYYLTGFTRFSPNDFQNVEERLPELNFNLLPTQIGCTPIFNTINAKIGHLEETSPRTNISLKSTRMDIFYGLHAPLKINEALTFTPVLGGEINEYFDKNTSAGTYTRYRGQIGFDAQFNAYAQWDYTNPIWNINGLRHIVRPMVIYRYIPEGHSGTGPVPPIDRHIFTTNINPIELAYLRDVDTARELHTVRFGFENVLQTRNKCYGSRELASLRMYQDYLIKESAEKDHWSFWYTEFAFNPAYWINFKLYDRVNVNNFTLNELNTSICVTDARFWKLSYSINTLHHRRHQDSIDLGIHITPRTSIRGRCRYDFKLHEVTQAIGSISTRLGNAWLAEFQVIHRKRAVRESNWEMTLLFNLLPLNVSLLPIPL
jgi:LPS-assembly protein